MCSAGPQDETEQGFDQEPHDDRSFLEAINTDVREMRQALLESGQLPRAADAIQRFLAAADEITKLASEPVRLALIGRYSSGKSKLIGALLGNPELLPSDWGPTTGNVTVLRVNTGEVQQATRLDLSISFLTDEALGACVRSMAGQIAHSLRDMSVGSTQETVNVASLRPVESAEDLAALERWIEAAWKTSVAPQRLELAELHRVLCAFRNGHGLLGASVRVADTDLRQAAARRADVGTEPPERLPRPALYEVRKTERLDGPQLAAVFDLIDYVAVNVVIPGNSWGSSMIGNGGLIFDFPGAGSTVTGMRDHYLAVRDLNDVTVALVTIDASVPHDSAPMKLINDYYAGGKGSRSRREHGLLACGTKADLLAAELERLAEHPQRLDGVLLDSQASRTIEVQRQCRRVQVAGAQEITLVAAQLHDRLINRDRDAQARLAVHAKVAARLRQDLPNEAPLASALQAVAVDGGIGELRNRLSRHVAEHGFSLAAERARDHLAHAVTAAGDAATRLTVPARPGVPEERTAPQVNALVRKLRERKRALPDAIERDLPDLTRQVYGDGRSIADVIEQAVAVRVTDWPEWEALYATVRDGIVVPEKGDADFPVTTAPFRARFTETLADLGETVDEIGRDVENAWLAQQRDVMADMRASIARLSKDQPELREPLTLLRRFADLDWLCADGQQSSEAHPAESADPGRDRFPLRDDLVLAWHPDSRFTRQETVYELRHQIHIRRLHRELTSALAEVTLDQLTAALHARAAELAANVKRHAVPDPQQLKARERAGADPAPHAALVRRLHDFAEKWG